LKYETCPQKNQMTITMKKILFAGLIIFATLFSACNKDKGLEGTQWQGINSGSYSTAMNGNANYKINMLISFTGENNGNLHAIYDIAIGFAGNDSVFHVTDTADAPMSYTYKDKAGTITATFNTDELGQQTLTNTFAVDGNTMTMKQDDQTFTLTKVK
jgi:hypothetical protein